MVLGSAISLLALTHRQQFMPASHVCRDLCKASISNSHKIWKICCKLASFVAHYNIFYQLFLMLARRRMLTVCRRPSISVCRQLRWATYTHVQILRKPFQTWLDSWDSFVELKTNSRGRRTRQLQESFQWIIFLILKKFSSLPALFFIFIFHFPPALRTI